MNIQDKLLEYEKKLISAKKHTFFNNMWKQIFRS